MRRREIIFAVIVSVMILCNIIGTVAVVAVNVTSGRDLVKECLMLFNSDALWKNKSCPLKKIGPSQQKQQNLLPPKNPW